MAEVSGIALGEGARLPAWATMTVNALVPELKRRGVQTIVVLLHEGGAQTGLSNECIGFTGPVVEIANALDPAIDAIVSGHTHKAYNCSVGGKLVTSAAHAGLGDLRHEGVPHPCASPVREQVEPARTAGMATQVEHFHLVGL